MTEGNLLHRLKYRDRRIKWRITVCLLLSLFLCPAPFYAYTPIRAAAEQWQGEPEQLYAHSAVLMDGDSGRILYGKNETEILPMASTTKIMTCILALELAQGEEICQVSQNAASQPEVHLGMRTGEMYYLKDLLYSMMLESHNDSAVCVAEHVGGSVEEFAALMDQKARELGCVSTHYVTPNGLDGEDAQGSHSTTAKDLALVLRYCISLSPKSRQFLEITTAPDYRFTDVSGKREVYCQNHNALLTLEEGAVSGKTGFTGKAGYCYVGAVKRDGRLLVGALLACGWPNNRTYKWKDMHRLLEYGFSRYQKKTIDPETIALPDVAVLHGTKESIPVQAQGSTETLAVLAAEEEKLQARISLPKEIEAPVEAGEAAGSLQILLEKEILAEYPLVYQDSVRRFNWSYCLKTVIKFFILFF